MMLSNGSDNVVFRWLSLLRVQNLLIIVLTQYLLGYGIIRPFLKMNAVDPPLGHLSFFILVLVTVLIAAAGYIINDHFDVNTDRRNKSWRNMLDGRISVRKAIRVYYIMNVLAVLGGFYLAMQAGSFQLGLIFPAIIGLLWFYSSRYQRMVFWGNLIIALLSAMVLLIVWLFEYYMLVGNSSDFVSVIGRLADLNAYVWAYALFAFLTSLIREVLKDLQDLEGDMATGFRTIPVVWGQQRARAYAAVLVVLGMAMLAGALHYLFNRGLMMPFWYLLVAVMSLFAYLLVQLFKARDTRAYGFLSTTVKIIMLAGILSMELIYISL